MESRSGRRAGSTSPTGKASRDCRLLARASSKSDRPEDTISNDRRRVRRVHRDGAELEHFRLKDRTSVTDLLPTRRVSPRRMRGVVRRESFLLRCGFNLEKDYLFEEICEFVNVQRDAANEDGSFVLGKTCAEALATPHPTMRVQPGQIRARRPIGKQSPLTLFVHPVRQLGILIGIDRREAASHELMSNRGLAGSRVSRNEVADAHSRNDRRSPRSRSRVRPPPIC